MFSYSFSFFVGAKARVSCILEVFQSLFKHPTTYILSNILVSRLTLYIDKIIGDHQCGFWRNRSTTSQIFCICQLQKKNVNTMGQYISNLCTLRKHMTQTEEKYCKTFLLNVLYPLRPVTLNNMYLNETCSKVHIYKYLSYVFPFWNSLKQGDTLLLFLSNFGIFHQEGSRKSGGTAIE
jgi:hypothetical protein